MLDIIDIQVDQALAFKLQGKISQQDLENAAAGLKEKIDQYGAVYIYEEVDEVTSVEPLAMIMKMKSLLQVGIKKIQKIVIISDKPATKLMVEVQNRFLPWVEIRCFVSKDTDKAIQFLKES